MSKSKIYSNLLELWELQGLEGRRRLQKLVFPDEFIYDKNNEHIEPKRVNLFLIKIDVEAVSTLVKVDNVKVIYKHIRKDGTKELIGFHATKVKNIM